jgi:metallo-beta-lactamase family protein
LSQPSIRFLGATETVTGSRYLINDGSHRVLVDCGLFQGVKRLRQRNWAEPKFDVASLDAVILTHAHIDHSGFLPRLHRLGYRGPVWCTPGTADLLKILWPDSGYLQESQAKHANRHTYSRHKPAAPLYTEKDARSALKLVRTQRNGTSFKLTRGIEARFTRAGHILGAAGIHLHFNGSSVMFSGDVGRPHDPIMKPAAPAIDADYLVVESTYGDRCHPDIDYMSEFADIVNATIERGGTVVIPAFAVGRAQHILHILAELRAAGRTPEIPIFLDSPMSINATELYLTYSREHALDAAASRRMCDIATYCRSANDSKALAHLEGPKIIISASGMATGGRVLHHLINYLPHPENTIVFVGFQAAGTRGRSLVDGADEIKIHGSYRPVRANVEVVEALSAHADYREILDWLRASKVSPRKVFVTHGEASAADAMRRRLCDEFGWDVTVPEDGSHWVLD